MRLSRTRLRATSTTTGSDSTSWPRRTSPRRGSSSPVRCAFFGRALNAGRTLTGSTCAYLCHANIARDACLQNGEPTEKISTEARKQLVYLGRKIAELTEMLHKAETNPEAHGVYISRCLRNTVERTAQALTVGGFFPGAHVRTPGRTRRSSDGRTCWPSSAWRRRRPSSGCAPRRPEAAPPIGTGHRT